MKDRGSNRPNVLVISGFDPTNLAGYGSDIRVISGIGANPVGVVTALTCQVPGKFQGIAEIDGVFFEKQLSLLFSCYKIHTVKIGMVYSEEVIRAVARCLSKRNLFIVIDPLVHATAGAKLLKSSLAGLYRKLLLSRAGLMTPNFPEALFLTGMKEENGPLAVLKKLHSLFSIPVLLKGGHLSGDRCQDYYYDGVQVHLWKRKRAQGIESHGTGCRLSSAIAAYSAMGMNLYQAIDSAEKLMTRLFRKPICLSGRLTLGHSW